MKIQVAALLSVVATASAGAIDIHRILASTEDNACEACFGLIDDARDCLRECNSEPYWNFALAAEDGTILNECLDPDREDRDRGTVAPTQRSARGQGLNCLPPSGGRGGLQNQADNRCDPVSASSVEQVTTIEQLATCCDDGLDDAGARWDDTCVDTFTQVEQCLRECFDGCLVSKTEDWFRCVQENTGGESDDLTGEKSCSRQSCINGFVDDEEDDNDTGEGNDVDSTLFEDLEDGELGLVGGSGSGDSIFDVENIAEIFEQINDGDLQECDLLDNFINSACRVGDTCCEDCNTELAESLDCLLNTIVGPFVAAASNLTSLVCEIPENCEVSSKDRRQLHTRTIKALNAKGQYLPKSSEEADLVAFFEQRRLDGTAGISDDVTYCINQMNRDLLVHNMTFATNKYMECTTAAALSQLQDEPEDGASFTGLGVLALVATVAVAFF